MFKLFFVILGVFFIILGLIGVILPILPAIPLLLVGAICLTKGSTRFNKWFTTTKFYKKYLDDIVKNKKE